MKSHASRCKSATPQRGTRSTTSTSAICTASCSGCSAAIGKRPPTSSRTRGWTRSVISNSLIPSGESSLLAVRNREAESRLALAAAATRGGRDECRRGDVEASPGPIVPDDVVEQLERAAVVQAALLAMPPERRQGWPTSTSRGCPSSKSPTDPANRPRPSSRSYPERGNSSGLCSSGISRMRIAGARYERDTQRS